jgi:N-acyl homoserine lactone hydrolase
MRKEIARAVTLCAACLLAGCASERGAREIRVYALDCGRMVMSGIQAADPCFLIRHPQGDLLWDAGLPASMAGRGAIKIGAVEITVERSLADLLGDLQLAPADIEYLALSHTHFDHVGNAALFSNSTWIVDADERTWAFRPATRASPAFANYASLENARVKLIERDDDYDVFGDRSVVIVQAPGHTPGHCVLLLRLSSGSILLAGDIWNTAADAGARKRSNQEEQSVEKVQRLAAANHARIVRQHVLEDFEQLPRFPGSIR